MVPFATHRSSWRIPTKAFLDKASFTPKWFDLNSLVDIGTKGGRLLMSLNVFPAPVGQQKSEGQGAKNRPDYQDLELRKYVFRCYIFQAVNVPMSDAGGTTDPCVRVTLSGNSALTKVRRMNLHPVYNESLQLAVSLPAQRDLRPDIVFEILDQDDDDVYSEIYVV